jgi:prepilin-type N-terminal cleavage/methylation domain-containing protein
MKLVVSRGFTLIEMLVVLLIMGLLVSVTVLSTTLLSRTENAVSNKALTVAQELSRLFELASQQALIKGEVLGWSMVDTQNEHSMSWWRWSSEASVGAVQPNALPQAANWVPLRELMPAVITLPENISLQLSLENRAGLTMTTPSAWQESNAPAVVFYPGREYSAFEIIVRDTDTGNALARVWPGQNGHIRWGAL